MMAAKMKQLNADIEFVYYPGDHFTVQTPQWIREGNEFFTQRYMEWLKK
jgi:hypothetical protein